MGWNEEEVNNKKKGMSTSSKVLLMMIVCIILIIILIIILLMNMKGTSFKTYINGVSVSNVTQNSLLTTVGGVEYVNIEKFSKLVGYEYHKGEYKSSTIDNAKCYVEGKTETATFYLNENTIYKLPLNMRDENYNEFIVKNVAIMLNEEMYASLEAISIAFNVVVEKTDNYFQVYTLDYLVKIYDANVKKWGYTSIKDQSFENKKALLYGCIIVKKNGGLYKIIDTNNKKEIVLDRYTDIKFSETMQEFWVTDSAQKVGIINLDGTTKVQPSYDNISLLDKESNLYIVKQAEKYGVISGQGRSIIYPEYDSVGLSVNSVVDNKYLILDKLIPVCKDKKWGAFDKNGNLIINVEYDEFGYNSTSIEINGVKEVVEPVLEIEIVNGIVIKKDEKYGLLNSNGQQLVKTVVEGIYAINGVEDEDSKYFMLYNGEESNLIERLIAGGKIEKKEEMENSNSDFSTEDSIQENNVTNQENQNTVSNQM